jgi:hypothetical protein
MNKAEANTRLELPLGRAALTFSGDGTNFVLVTCADEAKTFCRTFDFNLDYGVYDGARDDAYIFYADHDALPLGGNVATVSHCLGRTTARILISRATINTTLTIHYAFPEQIRIETELGSIVLQGLNKNAIIRVNVKNLNNHGIFHTDAAGLGMQKRVRGENYAWGWTPKVTSQFLNITANYNPVNSAIRIEDPATKDRVTLMPDRPQGGSSVQDGEVELMIHRRMARGPRGLDDVTLNEADGITYTFEHILIFSNEGTSLFPF